MGLFQATDLNRYLSLAAISYDVKMREHPLLKCVCMIMSQIR